jgi:hypothetical protein
MGKHPFSREEETNLTRVFQKAFQIFLLQMHKDSGATDESIFLLNFFLYFKRIQTHNRVITQLNTSLAKYQTQYT